MKVISISLREDQIDFLDEWQKTSGLNKSELIRQALDRATPELTRALDALRLHGFGPAPQPERKPARKKNTQRKTAAKKRTAAPPADDSDESPAYKKWKELL